MAQAYCPAKISRTFNSLCHGIESNQVFRTLCWLLMQEFILDNDGCAFKRKMPKIKVHQREEAPVSIGNDDQHFAISSSQLPAT